MDESEDNMSAEDIQSVDSPLSVKLKPKKRSLVERELETNLTARVTSPVTTEGTSTSRYGRARRLKTEAELDAEKAMKPLRIDTSKSQPQAYKMHASNSPIRKESPKHAAIAVRSIEDQIENIYNENMSLSRFGSEEQVKALSPAKKFPKVYIKKDLTQKPDTDTVALIKNVFSPVKKSNTHLNNILERSSEKYSLNGHGRFQNGFPETSSVVKTLDFDGKKKKDVKEKTVAKNEGFELEAGCEYQVGDLAWARVGSYPFWPCIVTREPFTELFLKKKVFGRVEHDVVHVTFFGDNGRRGWIVDNLLRKYLGRAEFESSREKFTPEAKKKDPRLYAAHFVSEKKLPLWNISVEEAEAMLREPKRLRIDILHELLEQGRVSKSTPKREKGGKIVRTDSDVSLSESLYDTLFSEDDAKTDENNRSKKTRNKSLDVSEVVTACLDNMAAKSGIIQIQKQSHMDRWLQKAKSKTPEKTQPKFPTKSEKKKDGMKKKSKESRRIKKNKSLSAETNLTSYQNEHDYSSVNYENHDINEGSNKNTNFGENGYDNMADNSGIGIISKIDSLHGSIEDYNQDDIIITVVSDDIVINGSVNKNIEVIDENVTKSEEIEDSLQDISVINPDNSINSTRNEQIETKIESAQKKKKTAKVAIEKRRSKRKRLSVEEDNNILISKIDSLHGSIEDNQDDIITTVVSDDIVINGSVNKNIEVIDENVTKSEEIEDSLQDISVINPDNSINSTRNEQIETKIESAQKKKKKAKVAIEKRRSKRKRLSVEEDNNILISKIDSLHGSIEDNQDDIITTVVSDDIVINGSVNKNIEVIDENVTKSEEIEDSLQDISVINPDNSINSTRNEQIETKIESAQKKKKTAKVAIEKRRSKRKRLSVEEDNNILKYMKPDKKIKKTLSNLDDTQTDISLITDMSDVENMNKDSFQDVLSNKILDSGEQNCKVTDEEPVVPLDVSKNTLKSKESIQNELTQLNGQKAIVIIEQLKISTLETMFMAKESKGQDEVLQSEIQPKDKLKENIDKTDSQNVAVNSECLVTDNLENIISKTTVSEPNLDVAKNVTEHENVVIKQLNSLEAVKTINENETVLNEKVSNDEGIFDKKIDEFDKMDVDNQNMNNNEEKQKDSLNSTKFVSKKAETNPRPTKESKNIKPHKFVSSKVPIQSEPNIASTVVTDTVVTDDPEFMKYLELRQDAVRDEQPELSQDEIVTYLHQTWLYEESNKSDRKKTDDVEQSNLVKGLKPKAAPLPKKIKKKSKADKECNLEMIPMELDTKNVVIGEEMYIFDRTLSQDYDEITEDVLNVISNPPIDSSINEDQDKDLGNVDGDLNVNGGYIATFSQDYDEVGEAVDIKKKLSVNQGDCSSNKEDSFTLAMKGETDCDKVACDNTFFYKDSSKSKKKKKKLNAVTCTKASTEDIPILSKDTCINSDQKTVEEKKPELDTVEQNIETSVNNQEINELKEKKRKSPKLSLNRTKNASANIQVSDLKNNPTESPVNIFLDTPPDRDKGLREDLQTDLAEPDCDVNLQKLIETKINIHKVNGLVESKESTPERRLRDEFDPESASIKSEDSGVSTTRRKIRTKEKQYVKKAMDDPEFIKYLEFRQDALIDEQPELSQEEIVTYLYQTWLYEESNKSDQKKTDDVEQSNLVKGLNQEIAPQPKKIKKKPKVEKERDLGVIYKESTELDIIPKEKTKRKTQSKPCYNEDFSDLEEEDLETFNIFDPEEKPLIENGEQIDEVELYFEKLTKPKPNVFKGFSREKVCEICELTGNLIKCKSCHGTFHVDCVKNEEQLTEVSAPTRGRKKKKKTRGRKPKGYYESLMDSGSQSDERSQDASISEDFDMSIEDETESHITVDAEHFEVQWELKMKELTPENEEEYESDQEVDWDAPPGQCEIVDIKRKAKPVDYSDFKCNNCYKYDTPLCFVCKSDKSPKALNEVRQKCHVARCHRYYHLECLEYWPQTQFNSWEPSKANKKVIECVEALSCPRHVCHTCVSDDPRGCKTRFCGDKLARCIKCPATYHSFTKCLPAGTQILTASQIICPRHCEHRAGQVPRHVNTGWCFICALGGTLICCEYCPTSFHAECLNIKPPEGSYMCEDCETGRLPLYGEMVWVKLGHYRWWPGIILHPCEIPDNILAVKHSPGEFVVRFFGQYDHYWVNRGRVFPFQEGDSGKISSQKSKIDAAFTTAMEHAQRACEILKNVEPNEEEEEDIASSLLPPHYVKLKANKPAGSLPARRDLDANSLTQCDCDPKQPDPCGPYSHCLNRMLLTECGPLCRAGERCNNRAFEKRLYPRLAPHRAPARGWGLRALQDIRQGQFVIEYVGELIDEEEFRRRMCRKHEVRDENFYFLTLDKERMIDAGPKGNLARFMNHCCEPNCETQKWTVLGDVRVGLFALRDIPANSEVTFNYNLECAGIEKKRCLCGAKRCSGYIGAKPKQEEAQPKKIKVPAKRTYKKRKNVEDSPSTSKTKPPNKVKITKPIKPRELTEIEKDLLIIKNATNGMSSDSEGSRLSSVDEKKDPKALKRKRVSFSTEEVFSNSSGKKLKLDDTSAKVTE